MNDIKLMNKAADNIRILAASMPKAAPPPKRKEKAHRIARPVR